MSRHSGLSIITIVFFAALRCSAGAAADKKSDAANPDRSVDQPALTGAAENGEKFSLRYRFRADEVVRSKVAQQTKIETTIAGTTQTAEMTSISTKAWRVINVDDNGQVTFDTTIEAIDMRNQLSGRQEVRYNSQTDAKAPPGYETAAASVGKVLTTITIDPAGKLLRREKKHQVGMDNGNVQVIVPLPADPIAIGEAWSVPVEVPISLEAGETKSVTVKNRYQLDKVEDGVATISVGTVLPPINDPRIRAQLIQRMTKGTIHFDLKAGRVISQKTDLDEQVIGFSGPKSSLHYLGHFSEELLADESHAAGKRPLKR